MTLYIDTTQADRLQVFIRDNQGNMRESEDADTHLRHAQALLPAIKKVLDDGIDGEPVALQEITAIEVNPGPGSFTGTRVGLAVANALGFALAIPVNNLAIGEAAVPVYSGPPNITISQKS